MKSLQRDEALITKEIEISSLTIKRQVNSIKQTKIQRNLFFRIFVYKVLQMMYISKRESSNMRTFYE